jgi:hypothetical protein
MKIPLASDGSEQSNKMVTEFAERTFSPKINKRIISASDRLLSIKKTNQTMGPLSEIDAIDMMNTDQLMGSLPQYNLMADHYSLQSVKNAVNNVSTKKRPKLSPSIAAIEVSPKSVILNAKIK